MAGKAKYAWVQTPSHTLLSTLMCQEHGSLGQAINSFLPSASPHSFLPHESTGSFRELSELGLLGQCLAQPVPILQTHQSLPECTQLHSVCTRS